MTTLTELVHYCDQLLEADGFRDYCPNGLQVEGRSQVQTLVTGVTASLQLVEAAVEAGADALLVHHGYFWKNEAAPITGMKRARLKRLLEQEISLIAYHLPLDAHVELGNNAQLGRRLDLTPAGRCGEPGGAELVWYSDLDAALSAQALSERLQQVLQREPLRVGGASQPIRRVAWCTGAAQSYIELAVAQGADAYISGEISESTVHTARELGIYYFAAGHHATERYGVQALGEHLAQTFGIEHRFLDLDNPV